MLAKVRQLVVEIHFANGDEKLEEILSRVKSLKSIEDAEMIHFDSKYNMWSKGPINVLDLYRGPNCFEIAFYQHLLLPSSTAPINPVFEFSKH